MAVDDVATVAERLGTPVDTIARQGLSARLTGISAVDRRLKSSLVLPRVH